jgi:hypothetical protein
MEILENHIQLKGPKYHTFNHVLSSHNYYFSMVCMESTTPCSNTQFVLNSNRLMIWC